MRSPVCCAICDFTSHDGEEMKSLAEVIKALEICTSDRGGCEGCPYDPDCKPDKKWDEAIYYLKEYQDMLEDPGKMVEYLRQASIQRSKDLARERTEK